MQTLPFYRRRPPKAPSRREARASIREWARVSTDGSSATSFSSESKAKLDQGSTRTKLCTLVYERKMRSKSCFRVKFLASQKSKKHHLKSQVKTVMTMMHISQEKTSRHSSSISHSTRASISGNSGPVWRGSPARMPWSTLRQKRYPGPAGISPKPPNNS